MRSTSSQEKVKLKTQNSPEKHLQVPQIVPNLAKSLFDESNFDSSAELCEQQQL